MDEEIKLLLMSSFVMLLLTEMSLLSNIQTSMLKYVRIGTTMGYAYLDPYCMQI